MIDIPKTIVPENSKLASKDNSSPIIHFKDTDAFLTSFNVTFGDCSNTYVGELISTEEIEKRHRLKIVAIMELFMCSTIWMTISVFVVINIH